jgi:hypothetical protein
VHRQSGQATVEWVGLVLLAALILGAAAALRSPGEEPGPGSLVAERIVCAAKGTTADSCAGEAAPPAVRPPPRAPARPAPVEAPPSPARVADAFRRLRGVGHVARHAWIVCLGYRRWRYELEHPLAPTEALPLDEALAIANTCLNPYAFLTED